jgi:hypothetical protein
MTAVNFKVGDIAVTSGASGGGEIQLSQIKDEVGSAGTLGQLLTKSASGLLWANSAISSTTVSGIVQLATDAETQGGVISTKAVVPSALQSKLSDSTSTASSTTIASSTAVKSAYDLAAAAVPDSTFTAKGDIVVGTGSSTYEALSVGTDAYVLTADSTQPGGVKWAPSSGGGGGTSPMTSATTLYVNPTTGNNATAARGTDRPFATISAAITAASEGDTIFLSAGTFTENFTINKGIHLCGTFSDQATWSGTKIVGNVVVNLVGAGVIRNLAVSDIYFISTNSTSPLSITGMSPGAGGINTFTGCAFTQQNVTDTAQFAFQTSGTWTRTVYLRDCTIDGNFRHNAGTTAGASGYIVIDALQGVGNFNMYHSILTGTVEYRNPSNTLASILQTGGIALINNASSGITANSATTSSVFGGTGFSYKGTAASPGTCTVYFQGGSNQGTGKVDIGANVIYGWTGLTIDSANLTVNAAAIPYTTAVPAAAAAITVSQQRPRLDLLRTASAVTATNRLPAVIDSTTGILYSVAPIDLPLTTLTLTSTASTTLLSVPAATFRGVVINVSVSDATGGNFYTDTLQVNHNGTTANLQVISGARIGTAPYTASAAVTAGNLVVSVTSASANSTKYVGSYQTFAI